MSCLEPIVCLSLTFMVNDIQKLLLRFELKYYLGNSKEEDKNKRKDFKFWGDYLSHFYFNFRLCFD